jgi:long-chain fatty acid transport protein
MKRILMTTAASVAIAGTAYAGGVDRSGQSVAVIFENGNYAELSFGSISPSVSGQEIVFAPAGLNSDLSGDMAPSYTQFSGAIKHRFSDKLDAAIIFDQPFGADVLYATGTGYYAQGASATLDANSVTGVLQYTMPSNFSVFGGLRYQTMGAVASVPFVGGYQADGATDGGVGYLVGVAYEKPEIALRVALTYNSKIKHEIATEESTLAATLSSVTEVTSPQSVNLEFQSGVAKDTLVFGSIRWVEWSAFDITPALFQGATGGSLVSYDNDTITYSLGVGRRINENWSAAVSLGYEKANGGFASNLGPTDGSRSIGIGATYTKDNMKITGGVRYVSIGDAQTQFGPAAPAANFTDNHALGFGVKVGFSF